MVKRKFGKLSESFKTLYPWLSAKSSFVFYVLLTDRTVKLSHILTVILLCLSNECPGPIKKVFRYRTWTSVKKSVKQLSSRTKFSTFSQFSCSNFILKLREKLIVAKFVQKKQISKGLARARSKKLFSKIIMEKIYEKNSCFHVK